MAQNKQNDGFNEYIEYFDNLTRLANIYGKTAQEAVEAAEKGEEVEIPTAYKEMAAVWSEMTAKFMENPEALYEKQVELYNDYLNVWNNAWKRYIGEESEPLYAADPRDKRFKDKVWNNDLIFDFIKQSYLMTNKWLNNMVGTLNGVDKKTLEKFEFYTKQFCDAMSPSNFAMTNPEVIREAINTNGASILKGMQNLARDLEKGGKMINIATADKSAFRVGENLATTKGKVVFKNDLIELIQYNPVGTKNYKTPLLIMPAWINKFYIMDLSEENSMVKWLLEQGYSVFMISWVNPDKRLAHKKFEDYMLEGPLAAIDAIEQATGEKEVNVMAYCLGGTLLSATMAYMKTKNDNRIKSATLLTTMVDFGNVGDMAVFIDEKQLDNLDKQMKEHGFLGGDEIAAIFSAIRANDLIWSFVVNNYLMGKDPMPFDILYWNADTTRMPADTHSFYLRNMYLKNLLRKAGGITLAGVPIDVSTVEVPCYILSTFEDHIAPWKTTFETMKLFKGKNKFVLAGSGHIAGVINHPSKNKYGYWENDVTVNPQEITAAKWLDASVQHEGSWWPNWNEWAKKFSGEMVNAYKVGTGICDAPGQYVLVK
jgi:polyhydroxyalkanoate synthase